MIWNGFAILIGYKRAFEPGWSARGPALPVLVALAPWQTRVSLGTNCPVGVLRLVIVRQRPEVYPFKPSRASIGKEIPLFGHWLIFMHLFWSSEPPWPAVWGEKPLCLKLTRGQLTSKLSSRYLISNGIHRQ